MATPVSNPNFGGTQPPASQVSSRSQNLDRADFLQMLMTQMKFQDPLSPMSNEEFASQMAQFSSLQELQGISAALEQSIQTNLLMSQSFNNTMAATLIGKYVTAESNELRLGSNGSEHIDYKLSDAATEISIDIKNAEGVVVRTIKVNPQAEGNQSIPWDGLNGDGQRVPAGNYTFEVHATDSTGTAVDVTTVARGVVESVRYEDGNVLLLVAGREIQLSQVLSLSNSGDPS